MIGRYTNGADANEVSFRAVNAATAGGRVAGARSECELPRDRWPEASVSGADANEVSFRAVNAAPSGSRVRGSVWLPWRVAADSCGC